jgi:hypothetical protein
MLYGVTTLIFAPAWPILWYLGQLTTAKNVMLLFSLDIILTIEAAFYSDIVFIAILHVFMIPAFFALIYFDLVRQHKADFSCFVCGKPVQENDEIETIKRIVQGKTRNVIVHSACIDLDRKERKAFSKRAFRKGIPE